MLRRILTATALILVAGCGSSPVATRADSSVTARSVELDTHRWQRYEATKTGNRLFLDLTLANFDAKRGLNPDGKILMNYTDRTGFFGTRDTIYAYYKLVSEAGQVIEVQQARLARQLQEPGEPAVFKLTDNFRFDNKTDSALTIEFAFFGTDRHGSMTWDSNDGKNYLFELDTSFPVPRPQPGILPLSTMR